MDLSHFLGRKERTLQEIRLKIAAGTPLTSEEAELRERDNARRRETARLNPSSHKRRLIAIRAKLRAQIPLTAEEAEYRDKTNKAHELYHRKRNPNAKPRKKRLYPVDRQAQLAAQEADQVAKRAAKAKAKLEKTMRKKLDKAATAANPFRSLPRSDQLKAVRVRKPRLKQVEPRRMSTSHPQILDYDDDIASDLAARISKLLSKTD